MIDNTDLLVNTTVYVSTFDRKYKLLDVIKGLMYRHSLKLRVVNCMHMLHTNHIDIKRGKVRPYFHGVSVCGSVWMCPVCAERITSIRREELREALALNDHLIPVMVTFTLQHEREDKLYKLLDALNGSYRELKSGRWWRSFSRKYGVVAYVAKREIRGSRFTGWHPHIHTLLFLDIPADRLDIQALKEEIIERYTSFIAERGEYASKYHSIEVSLGDSAVASYIEKWSLVDEMSASNIKDGRAGSLSPFQLAELAGQGDKWAEHMFIEYASVTFRLRQVTWSHHGRQVLGLGKLASDKELAIMKPDADDVVIVSLTRSQWKQVLRFAVQGELLDVAERGGADAVMRFIADLSPP